MFTNCENTILRFVVLSMTLARPGTHFARRINKGFKMYIFIRK